MSVEVLSWVFKNSKQKGNCRLMMVAIADGADDNGDAFPGVEKLADKCGISIRTAQNIIERCEASGELRVYSQMGTKTRSGWTNLYRVVMPGINDNAALTSPKISHLTVHQISILSPRPIKKTDKKKFPKKDKEVNLSAPLKGVQEVNLVAPLANPQGVNLSAPHGVNLSAPESSVYPSVSVPNGTVQNGADKSHVDITPDSDDFMPDWVEVFGPEGACAVQVDITGMEFGAASNGVTSQTTSLDKKVVETPVEPAAPQAESKTAPPKPPRAARRTSKPKQARRIPANGADVDLNEWRDNVNKVWRFTGAMAWGMVHMLRGTATGTRYGPYNLETPLTEAQQILDWHEWYEANKNDDPQYLVATPITVQSSFGEWQQWLAECAAETERVEKVRAEKANGQATGLESLPKWMRDEYEKTERGLKVLKPATGGGLV